MDEYITNKKDMRFASEDSLKAAQAIVQEVNYALNDKSRVIATSAIGTALGSVVAAGVGIGGAGLAALGGSGVVGIGGLAAAGSLALFAPLFGPAFFLVAALSVIAKKKKEEKLKEAKELLYKDAITKQNAIIDAMEKDSKKDKERIEYLEALNELLRATIVDLRHDLGYCAAMK